VALTRLREWLRPLAYLGQNALTLGGAALTTSAALTMIVFWVAEVIRDRPTHPYEGILLFLILPGFFVLGLAMMPAGLWLRRRRLKKEGVLPSVYPHVDFHLADVRRGLAVVAVLTIVNLVLLSTASYKGVEYMESNQFCGLTCHTVMAPQYNAFVDSPHARVGCVRCHIGPGAPWFVRSKLSGVRQVFAVTFETYSRPIPSPVKHLRPARETCEQCHWPERFVGDRFVVRTRYGDDEKSSRASTVLVLKVGGRGGKDATGIHGRHVGAGVDITYTTADRRRQVIPRVTVVHPDGRTDEYVSSAPVASPDPEGGERRRMDCMDCHNRPTHAFELPERAVDEAIGDGRISADLPFMKKKAVEVLRAEYPDRDAAARTIADALTSFYRRSYPAAYQEHRAALEASVGAVQAIYRRNVFPEMKVTWGTYPNNIGHEDFIGCFRCHDDSHKRADGATITQDCTACHAILAQDERDPKVLSDLGLQ
jgi:NapC/NirT cytochrome c family protein